MTAGAERSTSQDHSADEHLNIVRVPSSVVPLLRKVESDLRKELSQLDVHRRGVYRAAQFNRPRKSSRPGCTEGTYNPTFDDKGNVTKVIKFASDETAQVALLGNLKTLIDESFGEIAQALNLSPRDANSACPLTASAEDLAASIDDGYAQEQTAVPLTMSGNMQSASAAVSMVTAHATAIRAAAQQGTGAVGKPHEAMSRLRNWRYLTPWPRRPSRRFMGDERVRLKKLKMLSGQGT